MVARIKCGKSIRGILNYNESKVAKLEAELLMASGFMLNPTALSFARKLDRFEKLTSQNERSKTNALHITLNFSNKDMVDDEKMKAIATDYMQHIGFGNQPFLMYRHYDAAHPHIHIATVTIEHGGNRIETFNIGKNQSEAARKDIEIRYGLIKAEDQQKEATFVLRPANLQAAVYGKAETKAAISSIVREVTSTYKFTSLPELNAVLGQFNITAERGAPGSRMYENNGLVYQLLDEQRQKTGIPIKASAIYDSPTLKNLEKRFAPNEVARKPYGLRMKHQLDKAIASAVDLDSLEAQLQAQGLRILLRKNSQGNVYGITFIDNATRTVFNGSDLGKNYSAQAFVNRLRQYTPAINQTTMVGDWQKAMPATGNLYPASQKPVIETLLDIALSDRYERDVPDPFKKKKKKKLQQE